MKNKVYDCFCYFNEDMILQIRLETLWDMVDIFVISEASYTHAGESRARLFDIANFEKYKSKIRYIPLDIKPAGENNAWKNENFIRNNIVLGLFDAQPNDLILVSDIDEIPRPEKISEYDTKYLRGDFKQYYYSYYFNNFWLGEVDLHGNLKPNSNIFDGTKITTYQNFMEFFKGNASSLRIYKSSGILRSIKRSWFKRYRAQKILNGGWHFTWIFDIAGIVTKIESTAHQEFNVDFYKNPKRIRELIQQGRDFHKPNSRYEARVLKEPEFPKYLVDHQESYKEFIL